MYSKQYNASVTFSCKIPYQAIKRYLFIKDIVHEVQKLS